MMVATIKMGTIIEKVKNWFRSLKEDFFSSTQDIIILKLTLIFIIFHVRSQWSINTPLKILAIYMLVNTRLTLNKSLWGILIAGVLLINISEWAYIDNHKYLATYWCLSCFCALFYREPLRLLKNNARLLIGLCFLFSVIWKLMAGQYLNGHFFQFTLLTDPRFEYLTGYLGDFRPEVLAQNYEVVDLLVDYPLDYASATLNSHPRVTQLALFMSYSVLLLEGFLGIIFLLPSLLPKFDSDKRGELLNDIRNGSLVFFIFTTYTLVSVSGFNYILILLGISQADLSKKRTAALYGLGLLWTEMKKLPLSHYYNLIHQLIS